MPQRLRGPRTLVPLRPQRSPARSPPTISATPAPCTGRDCLAPEPVAQQPARRGEAVVNRQRRVMPWPGIAGSSRYRSATPSMIPASRRARQPQELVLSHRLPTAQSDHEAVRSSGRPGPSASAHSCNGADPARSRCRSASPTAAKVAAAARDRSATASMDLPSRSPAAMAAARIGTVFAFSPAMLIRLSPTM